MKRNRIVVIEDEPEIREVLQYNLRREGYVVTSVATGEEGWEVVRREAPDLVLLDLLLPGLDGIELCRRLKSDTATRGVAIIMLTAKGEEADVVLGLGVGADDYVTKPFSPRELIARVSAVLRRTSSRDAGPAPGRLVRPGIVIDPERHEVLVDSIPVTFTATEFRLLHFLATHAGRVFTRDALLGRVIGEGATVIDRNIDVHVRSLRKKLGPRGPMIETVRGVGYRFSEGRPDAGAEPT